MKTFTSIADAVGLVCTHITGNIDSGELVFYFDLDGMTMTMHHQQDCCETVEIDDIVGDLRDLVGAPLLVAEEVSNDAPPKGDPDSFTWTFYKFATIKGYVDIKWYGTSNGYYSESVNCDWEKTHA